MASYYPPSGFHFKVEFTGVDGANADAEQRFQEVSGLSVEVETVALREGGENRFEYKLPRIAKYPNLVLKRGFVTNESLNKWCSNAIENLEIQPIPVVVSLMNENHEPLKSYAFINAYPLKWSISNFNAETSSIVIETIELYYQFFRTL